MSEVLGVRKCPICGVVVAEVRPYESDSDPWGLCKTQIVLLPNCDIPLTKHKKNYWCKTCGAKDSDLIAQKKRR